VLADFELRRFRLQPRQAYALNVLRVPLDSGFRDAIHQGSRSRV